MENKKQKNKPNLKKDEAKKYATNSTIW